MFGARVGGNMVDSCPNSTFKALLESQKDSQDKWLGVAETITFAQTFMELGRVNIHLQCKATFMAEEKLEVYR